jgi:hypothetical protein
VIAHGYNAEAVRGKKGVGEAVVNTAAAAAACRPEGAVAERQESSNNIKVLLETRYCMRPDRISSKRAQGCAQLPVSLASRLLLRHYVNLAK